MLSRSDIEVLLPVFDHPRFSEAILDVPTANVFQVNENGLERAEIPPRPCSGMCAPTGPKGKELGHRLLIAHHGVESAAQLLTGLLCVLKPVARIDIVKIHLGEPLQCQGRSDAALASPSTEMPMVSKTMTCSGSMPWAVVCTPAKLFAICLELCV